MSVRPSVISLALAAAFGLFSVASAAPLYTDITGGANLGPTGPFSNSTVTFSAGGTVAGTAPAGGTGTFSSITMTLGNVAGLSGPVAFGGPFSITAPGNFTATFNLTGGSVFNASRVDGIVTLTGGTLGAVGSIWNFSSSFTTLVIQNGSPGTFNVSSGLSSANFTLHFVSDPGNLTGVPEPASMLVWGSMAAAGLFLRRRNRS